MITTLTIREGRVLTGADYGDGITVNGAAERVGPSKLGGIHLAVDFDVLSETQVAFNAIRDLDTGRAMHFHTWPADVRRELERACRVYANQHPALMARGA